MGDSATAPETGRFADLLERIGAALDHRLAAPARDALEVRGAWAGLAHAPLPEDGIGVDGMAAELVDLLVPNGARMSDAGFWMFITAGPTTAPVLAATAANVSAPQRYTHTAFNAVEERSLEWLADLCGLPPAMRGVYSSGGSTANLVALGAARQAAFEAQGLDPAADGVAGAPAAVYATTETHHTVHRAAAVLGLGRAAVRTVAVDDRQRMRPDLLARALDDDLAAGVLPVAVVATAGTTNTGAIDPLREVAEVARARGVWVHVDGAYGLPGHLDERVRDAYDGLGLADSAIVDPHKWLGAPVGIAATFVRDRGLLQRAFTQGPADYLEGSFVSGDDVEASMDSVGIPYMDFGVELSAPARGVQVWAVLREEGRRGLTERIRRDNDFASYVAAQADAHPRLECLTRPQLSVACVRYVGDGIPEQELGDLNARINRRMVRETPYLASTTVVDGRLAIRPCFVNARTTWPMVEAFVRAIVDTGDEETRR